MFEIIINTYCLILATIFFITLFVIGKLNERSDRLKQQFWVEGEGTINRIYHHPKLIVYYIVFQCHDAINYFEERRTLGDITYKEGDVVPILFDSQSEFLVSVPASDKNLFSSKLSIGLQQEAKINGSNHSSILMDILNIGLIVICLIFQGIFVS